MESLSPFFFGIPHHVSVTNEQMDTLQNKLAKALQLDKDQHFDAAVTAFLDVVNTEGIFLLAFSDLQAKPTDEVNKIKEDAVLGLSALYKNKG